MPSLNQVSEIMMTRTPKNVTIFAAMTTFPGKPSTTSTSWDDNRLCIVHCSHTLAVSDTSGHSDIETSMATKYNTPKVHKNRRLQ